MTGGGVTEIRIAAAAHLIQKARDDYSVDQHGINVFIARALDNAGMLTIPAAEETRRAYEDRRYGDSDAYRRFWEDKQ